MDKETLSNYGWIVICVLVLAVMLALATPFGTFVADAVKSTTQGLFDVNQNALNSTGLINIDGQTFGEGGNGGAGNGGSGDQGGAGDQGNQGGTELPAVGTSAEDCTWDEIKAISEAGKGDEYFNLGDTKTFTTTDGKTIVMEIVAFDADAKADGTGTAGITWLSKYVLASHNMNSTDTNVGGWKDTSLRAWLQSDVYNTLPTDVQNAIAIVSKTYFDYATQSTLSCDDNVWIPSYREVYGDDSAETSGPAYSCFTDNASRVKYSSSGAKQEYWLRSANYTGERMFRSIGTYGGWNGPFASGTYYVVLGFCT